MSLCIVFLSVSVRVCVCVSLSLSSSVLSLSFPLFSLPILPISVSILSLSLALLFFFASTYPYSKLHQSCVWWKGEVRDSVVLLELTRQETLGTGAWACEYSREKAGP